jgi:hypothetical protein
VAKAAAIASSGAATFGGAWTFQGPQPITGIYNNSSGRATSLAVDPTNSAVVYAGTSGGGVWKTTDSGAHWNPLTDNQQDLAVGALAVDPNNHLIVYAGTGEPNRSIDSFTGLGVLKSTDAGATWTLYGGAQLAGYTISSLVVDRTNSNRVLVATSGGLFTSTDAGQTYTLNNSLLGLSPALPGGVKPRVDVLIQDPDAAHANNWYAAVSERCSASGFIAISTDGGVTWSTSIRASTLAGSPPVDRFGLGEGPGGVLYAGLSACRSTTPPFSEGQLVAVIKSSNYGSSWSRLTSAPDFYTDGQGTYQGWFDNVIGVDPTNANRAVFGGITMVVSADGGTTFTDVAKPYTGGPVHPDFHAIAFTGANTFYAGNDGGVWSTSNLGGTAAPSDWTNLNTTLGITTFYGGTPLALNRMIGGAQDAGTSGRFTASLAWGLLQTGDGISTQWRGDNNFFYGELPYLTIFYEDYTNPAGAQLAAPCAVVSDPACNDPTYALAPFLIDPNSNYASYVYGGTNKLYRSTSSGLPAGAGGWGAISGNLTTGTSIFLSGDAISAMAISSDGNTMVVGSFGGKLTRIDNLHGSPAFTDLTSSIPAFSFNNFTGLPWIDGLSLSNCVTLANRGQPTQCTVTVALGALGVGRVWAIPYSGAAINITGNLDTINPNTAVMSIVTSNTGSDGVYVGTVAGAFICGTCLNGAASWAVLGTGLPNSPVWQIGITADGADIVAWTHGRGAWALPRTGALTQSTNSLAFPTTTVYEVSSPQSVTVNNVGVRSVQLGILGFSGPNNNEFVLGNPSATCSTGATTSAIPPGASCQLNVVFAPFRSGPESATFNINNDTPAGPVNVSLSGTASRPVASLSASSLTFPDTLVATTSTQTLTYTNQGPGNLHVVSWQVTYLGEYTVTATSCIGVAIPPSGTCSLTVSFTPLAAGQRLNTLGLNDNSTMGPRSIPLSGNGYKTNATLSPTSLTFGPQDAGTTSAVQHVTVTANGPGPFVPLPNTQPGFLGPNASDFVADWGTCAGIQTQPGNTCTVNVNFKPVPGGAAGGSTRSANLDASGNANTTPSSISVTGTALYPSLTISPISIDFGNQSIGIASSPVTVTLSNSGTGNLIVTSISGYMQGIPGNPSVAPGTDHCTGVKVASGSTCTFAVTWTPTRVGWFNDNILIDSNDLAPGGLDQVLWKGTAQVPSPSAFPSQLTFGRVAVGASASQPLTFSNGGPGQMLISKFATSGGNAADFTVPFGQDQCTGGVVAAGGSCTIQIVFKPSAAQSEWTTLQAFVNTGGAGSYPPVSLGGYGSPFKGLYTMDGWGGIHSDDSPDPLYGPYWPGWSIARAAKGLPGANAPLSGFVLDGWGGLHSYGSPAVNETSGASRHYWPGWDIARDFAFLPNGSGGFVLDGWGGLHGFGVNGGAAPASQTTAYWPGWDIARKIVIFPDGTGGYVMDAWGGLHPFAINGAGLVSGLTQSAYWPGWSIARDVVIVSAHSGYILDGWGGLHEFHAASEAAPATITVGSYWPGWDIARSVWFLPGSTTAGYTLDGWGGLHPFGGATAIVSYSYWPGWDIAREIWGA